MQLDVCIIMLIFYKTCLFSQLYTADGDKKAIFPIIFEDLDFEATEFGPGVKFVISAVNWTMCRPRLDDYNLNISKLIMGLKAKGLKLLISRLHGETIAILFISSDLEAENKSKGKCIF